jgi:hypothetical protein
MAWLTQAISSPEEFAFSYLTSYARLTDLRLDRKYAACLLLASWFRDYWVNDVLETLEMPS